MFLREALRDGVVAVLRDRRRLRDRLPSHPAEARRHVRQEPAAERRPAVTEETRAWLKREIDAARRIRIRMSHVTECCWCGGPLPTDEFEGRRRFCTDRHRRMWSDKYGTYLPELTPRTYKVYATEERRIEARRETWRRSGTARYRQYVELTSRLGVDRQRGWTTHLAELRKVAA